jgi:hypothetical protein
MRLIGSLLVGCSRCRWLHSEGASPVPSREGLHVVAEYTKEHLHVEDALIQHAMRACSGRASLRGVAFEPMPIRRAYLKPGGGSAHASCCTYEISNTYQPRIPVSPTPDHFPGALPHCSGYHQLSDHPLTIKPTPVQTMRPDAVTNIACKPRGVCNPL